MTLTESGLLRLFDCIGSTEDLVAGSELRLLRAHTLVARGRVEPVFTWRAGAPFAWERADLEREVPPTEDAGDASDLAWSAARHLGAFGVYRDRDEWQSARLVAARYYAVFGFETMLVDSAEVREERVRRHLGRQLANLADGLQEMFVRYGSAGGKEYGRYVAGGGAMVAAFATQMASDLAIRHELDALAQTLGQWAIRAAIPPDEALLVSADLRSAAGDWAKR